MKVRYKLDFGGGGRGGQGDAADAPDVGAEPDEAPVTAAGPDPEAAPQPRPVSRAARMFALAHHVERLVEAGELAGYAEAARALGLTRARLTQVMNLLLLAPEIQERVLAGELRGTERSLRRAALESDWDSQLAIVENITGETRI